MYGEPMKKRLDYLDLQDLKVTPQWIHAKRPRQKRGCCIGKLNIHYVWKANDSMVMCRMSFVINFLDQDRFWRKKQIYGCKRLCVHNIYLTYMFTLTYTFVLAHENVCKYWQEIFCKYCFFKQQEAWTFGAKMSSKQV